MIIFSITLKTEQELSQIFAINLCKNSSWGKKKKKGNLLGKMELFF